MIRFPNNVNGHLQSESNLVCPQLEQHSYSSLVRPNCDLNFQNDKTQKTKTTSPQLEEYFKISVGNTPNQNDNEFLGREISTPDEDVTLFDAFASSSNLSSATIGSKRVAMETISPTPRKTYKPDSALISMRNQTFQLKSELVNLKERLKYLTNQNRSLKREISQDLSHIRSEADERVEKEIRTHEILLNDSKRQLALLQLEINEKDKIIQEKSALITIYKYKCELIADLAKNFAEIKSDKDEPDVIFVKLLDGKVGNRWKKYHNVIVTNVDSNKAARGTLINRTKMLYSFLSKISGSSEPEQMAIVVKKFLDFNPTISNEIGKKFNIISSSLTPSETADFISYLGLNFLLFRNIKRYFVQQKGWHLFPSNRIVQKELKNRIPNVEMKVTKISIMQDKETKISTTCVRAESLVAFIKDCWTRTVSSQQLVDYPGFEGNIWMFIGGDKGGDTTKLVCCFLNVEKPHSVKNIHIVGFYKGQDNAYNLRVAFDCYRDEFEELSELQLHWPGDGGQLRPLKIFLVGDCNFLSYFMGHQGCNSSNPCIYCNVPLADVSKPEKITNVYEKRTLDGITKCSSAYLSSKCTTKDAQKCGSIVFSPLLPIDLDHVARPQMHIIHGIVVKLWNSMYEECLKYDQSQLCASEKLEEERLNYATKIYTSKFREGDHSQSNDNELEYGTNAITSVCDNCSIHTTSTFGTKCCCFQTQYLVDKDKFSLKHFQGGEKTKMLEASLDKLNVDRLSYRSGTFVGNHVKKMIRHPAELTEAIGSFDVRKQKKYFEIFSLLSKIDELISPPKFLNQDQISQLKQYCNQFAAMYATEFSDESVLPKIHLLVHHVPEFAEQHKTVGLLSEQGVESLHAKLNKISRTYQSIRSDEIRLPLILNRHHVTNLCKTADGFIQKKRKLRCKKKEDNDALSSTKYLQP